MKLQELNSYLKSLESSDSVFISTTSMDDSFIYFIRDKSLGMLKIDISNLKGMTWVDFYMYDKNLYASHELNGLDFKTLSHELSKIFNSSEFKQWVKVELRNYYLNKLL